MEIDLRLTEARHAHDLLTSSIIPRPIAWVSSVNRNGETNLAPFSFFTGVQWHPPVLAFSVVNRADGTKKDTVLNIEQTREFVINLVSVDLLEPMELSAKPIPCGEDERVVKGIRLIPSKTVKPYLIREAKVNFECVLERIVCADEGANAGNLILGRVQLMHVQDDLVIGNREIDWRGLNALGRLSGNRYCIIDSVVESEQN
jgi:flavin reductase (DIM6/NTAB) family NADH-FMN oxidoreductase RutF